MTTTIFVCDTCRREDWEEGAEMRDGERLAQKVENAANGIDSVTVKRVSCLMGCEFACNVSVQANDKISYVLGKFEPSEEDAKGIVDYAVLHSESETGQVPFKTWPQAIKGHFRARLPKIEE